MRRILLGILTSGLLVLCVTGRPIEAAQSGIANGTCLMCHSGSDMATRKAAFKGIVNLGAIAKENLTLQITDKSLTGSVHEGFACTDCHDGITSIPHPEKLPPVNCANCHSGVAQKVEAGIHARKKGGVSYTPTCVNCHGAHQIRPKTDPKSSIYVVNVPGTCGACHGNAELMKAAGVVINNPLQDYRKSAHWRLLKSGKTLLAATCVDCHGAHKILPATNPKSPIFKLNIPKTCGRCHSGIKVEYLKGIHGKSLEKGNMQAPSCTDCHGEHNIEGPKNITSTIYPTTVAQTTCPRCHASVRLSQRFGLPTGMVKSYKASFHGVATSYGQTNVANCASCHGAHDILPSSNPESSINPANLQKTCGKCHPNATKAFADINIHSTISALSSPVLYWIKQFYIWLIALVVGGLLLHNLMDYVKRYKVTIRMLNPVSLYIRMTMAERVQHVLLLTSFFTLAITGFALMYPHSFWAIPFRLFPAGFDIRGLIHRAAAVVMIGDALYHLVYLVSTKRGRAFIRDIMPGITDVRELVHQIGYYLGVKSHEADFGRFSYAEKMEYLALVWGTIIMFVTGLILWFNNFSTAFLPEWGFKAAEMIHFYEAVLAFTTIIIWHLYMVFIHTDKPPFNPTCITGRMTRKTLEHHHPRALAELQRKKRREENGNEKPKFQAPKKHLV